jgi:hypothetical protein
MQITRCGSHRDRGTQLIQVSLKRIELSPCGRYVTAEFSGYAAFGREHAYDYRLALQFKTGDFTCARSALHEVWPASSSFERKPRTCRRHTRIFTGVLSFRGERDNTTLIASSLVVPHQSDRMDHDYRFELTLNESRRIRAVALQAIGMWNKRSRPTAQIPVAYTVSSRGHWAVTM